MQPQVVPALLIPAVAGKKMTCGCQITEYLTQLSDVQLYP